MTVIDAAGATDPGPQRERNEDAFAFSAPADSAALNRKGLLFAVADGLGGHWAGNVASSTAVSTLLAEYFAPSSHSRIEPALRQAVQAANLRIHALAQRNADYRSMETTLTALAIAGDQAYIAHVGDSRAYLLRGGALTQLTADHSEVADLVRMRIVKPDKAREHPSRNVLTRTLGSRLLLRPDFARHSVSDGDVFLLCSDGMWSVAEDDEIAQLLALPRAQEACDGLVRLALDHGTRDNVTAQVVRVQTVEAAQEQDQSRNGWLSGIFQRGRRE